MKKIIALLLLAVLLCGCTEPRQEETTAPPETTQAHTDPTVPAGIYAPGSDLELLTGGAVRCYLPEGEHTYGMTTAGSDVLLFSGQDATTLTRLSGDTLYPVASARLGCMVYPEDTAFRVSENGITYYDYSSRELIFLDNDLKEVSRLGMSASMVGKPVLSSNRLKVYYCTDDAVRVYDLETGLDKLLKSVSYPEQSVEDILLNDTVVRCMLLDQKGMEYSVFLSAETGEMLAQIQYGLNLTTGGDRYYAIIPEGILNVLLYGGAEEAEQVLTPADPFADAWFLEEEHAAVTVSHGDQAARLDYYDLETGLRTSAVEIPDQIAPWYVDEDRENGAVYLLGADMGTGQTLLCRWQLDATATGDSEVYTGPRRTAENPDEDGLARCAAYAREIGQAHGVEILVGAEALEQQPWDYVFEMEYHASVIQLQLEQLKLCLEAFPEGFFQRIHGNKRICIVRSITGNPESGSLNAAAGIQFWDGNTAYVALSAGDSLTYSFFHEMFHIIDSKVLSDSTIYYYWNNLNPPDFRYFEDYSSYLSADAQQYLVDENRAFIDAYSMSYAKEDRARIMEYASNPDNAFYFSTETMQAKLRTLCEGIREAFHLEDYPEPFLWEQYLSEPLTP